MYSSVDGYRCTAKAVAAASRRERPQCRTGTAAAAGPMLFNTDVVGSSRAVETSVFEPSTAESLHSIE